MDCLNVCTMSMKNHLKNLIVINYVRLWQVVIASCSLAKRGLHDDISNNYRMLLFQCSITRAVMLMIPFEHYPMLSVFGLKLHQALL